MYVVDGGVTCLGSITTMYYILKTSVDCMAKNKEVCTNVIPVLLLYRHIE